MTLTPDTGFEIRTLAVSGRARYFSVTETLHNIESLRVSGEGTNVFWRNVHINSLPFNNTLYVSPL